ncbi:hypothetical protein [Nocardia brasiliensis]|uniref:hypothetical protein n=1 Tax=Nocardia brasiliensis TaxID=37326 RepID=UPI0024557CDB|nr:hypothetical protein [Nocardia brasiliensis]
MTLNTGEYLTWEQAVGEAPLSTAFVAGVNFNPADVDDCEIAGEASARHGHERDTALMRQNDDLRSEVAQLHQQLADLTGTE